LLFDLENEVLKPLIKTLWEAFKCEHTKQMGGFLKIGIQ
jgi:hypothetical protein